VEAVELRAVGAPVRVATATGAAGQRVEADVEPVARRPDELRAHQHGVASGIGQVGRDDPVTVSAA
jgi:hypothetical protein